MDAFFDGLGIGHPHQQRQSINNNNNNNNPFMDFFRNVTGQAGGVATAAFDDFMNGPAPNFQQFVDQFQQQQQQQQQSTGPPPASTNALRHLPTISVSPEDLVEPSNRECCICFEEHNIGDKVVRLPCAHIYHSECITDWLSRHCTCPTCRFELETEDQNYEAGRRQRMSTRKPRYAKYELQRMSIRELINLLPARQRQQLRSSSYWSDKSDLIDYLIKNEIVDLISTPPPVEFPNLACLRAMGVGQLKRTMNDTGVYFDPREVVEKEDMVQIFVNSGRILLTDPPSPSSSGEGGGTNSGSSYGHQPPSQQQQRHRSYSFRDDNNSKTGTEDDDNNQSSSSTASSVVVETVGENDEDGNNSPTRVSSSRANSATASAASANEREAWGSERVMEEVLDSTSTTQQHHQQQDGQAAATEEKAEQEEEEEENNTTATGRPSQDSSTADVDGDAVMEDVADDAAPPPSAASASVSASETQTVDESENRKRERDETNHDEQHPYQRLSISRLKAMARERGIDLSTCLEKSEMVEQMMRSCPPPQQTNGVARSHSTGDNSADLALAVKTIQGFSISQVKTCGKALEMDFSNCSNHEEMAQLLVGASRRDNRVVKVILSLKPFMSMSIRELRLQAISADVNVNDCLEKSEILERLAAASAQRQRPYARVSSY